MSGYDTEDEEDHGAFAMTIHFTSEKERKRVANAIRKGRGVTLKPDMIHVTNGAGFFDSIRSAVTSDAAKNIGKAVGKVAIKGAVQLTKQQLAQRGIGGPISNELLNIGSNAAQQQLAGAGFMDFAKKVASNKIVKDVAKLGIQAGARVAKQQLAQRGYDGPLSNGLVDIGSQAASNQVGSGFRARGRFGSVRDQYITTQPSVPSASWSLPPSARGGSFRTL